MQVSVFVLAHSHLVQVAEHVGCKFDPGAVLGARQRIIRLQFAAGDIVEVLVDDRRLEQDFTVDLQHRHLAQRGHFEKPVRRSGQVYEVDVEIDLLVFERDDGSLNERTGFETDQSNGH